MVRVRLAASGATERETPFPGLESGSRRPPPGEAPRAEPTLCGLCGGTALRRPNLPGPQLLGGLVPSCLPRRIKRTLASLPRWRGLRRPVLGFGCDVQKKQEETVTLEAVSCPHRAPPVVRMARGLGWYPGGRDLLSSDTGTALPLSVR